MENVVQRISPEGVCLTVPRIRLLAFGSQLACKLRLVPRKCTTGNLSPLNPLQSNASRCLVSEPSSPHSPSSLSSPSESSSGVPDGSILVTCSLMRISRMAMKRRKVSVMNRQHAYIFFETYRTFLSIDWLSSLILWDALREVKCIEIVVVKETDHTHPTTTHTIGITRVEI